MCKIVHTLSHASATLHLHEGRRVYLDEDVAVCAGTSALLQREMNSLRLLCIASGNMMKHCSGGYILPLAHDEYNLTNSWASQGGAVL